LYDFFCGLKQVLQGCLNERCLPESVERKPFTLGFNMLPVLSEVALTYRCNLRCRFCYAACGCTRDDAAGEMSTAEVCGVLRKIRKDAQVPSVSFTGGEPTLREDLEDLVRYAKRELGLRVNLITNGTHIDAARARALASAGLASAQVSVEAPEEAAHDVLTQVPGSFRRSIEAVGHLRDAGILVHTNTTLNRLNHGLAPGMPAFVRSLGLERFSMNLVIPAGRGGAEGADINLRYDEIPELILRIRDEAARAGVEFMWYSPTPVCIFNPIPHRLGNKGCAACDGLLSVSPTGDVLPCSSWPEPVGNVLRDDFRAVWDSARARALRAKEDAPEGCRDCGDFALCQGACPLYWRHFGCDELVQYGEPHAAATHSAHR
jgi:radical SAM protein with 4Fe4S-binding SPASM domain